jgi:DNA mismatch endonuclease (patch repair protein)
MMAGIRAKDTQPEMAIRRGLHARGFRFRLHASRLPGKPDLVFPARRAVIFVHGCFWHCHQCHLFKWPSTRSAFWHAKILRNRAKDLETRAALEADGWRCLVIWECALKGRVRRPLEAILSSAAAWLKSSNRRAEICGYTHAAH